MKRVLSIVLALGIGVAVVAGCDSGTKEEPTVKELKNRGKPVDPKKK